MLSNSLKPIEFIRSSLLQEDMPRHPQTTLETPEQFEQKWYSEGRQIIADCAKIIFQLHSPLQGVGLIPDTYVTYEAKKQELIGAIQRIHARFAHVEDEFSKLKLSNPDKEYVYNSFIQLLKYNETNFGISIEQKTKFVPVYSSNPTWNTKFAAQYSSSNPEQLSKEEIAPAAIPIPAAGTQPASKNPNNQIPAPASGYATPGQIKLAPSWEDPRLK